MRKILLSALVLLSHQFLLGQSCKPSDLCGANIPKLCLQGLILSNKGYTQSPDDNTCPNGQAWATSNDLWLPFVALKNKLTIQADLLGNCPADSAVQLSIHESCSSGPIDCDVDCGGSPEVGAGINFEIGKTYYLRADGCYNATCPYQLTVFPSDGVEIPTTTLLPKWPQKGIINGLLKFPCIGSKGRFEVPAIECATAYRWKIVKGNAQVINEMGNQFNDNFPVIPQTDVTIVGAVGVSVQILLKSPGITRITCEALSGLYSTGITEIEVLVDQQSNVVRYETICPYSTNFSDPEYTTGPFLPNDTCGKYNQYEFINISKFGCIYDVTLNVAKSCDTSNFLQDLGTVNICKDYNFQLNNISIEALDTTLTLVTIGKDNGSVSPPVCTSYYKIRVTKLPPKISQSPNSDILCPGDSTKILVTVANLQKNNKISYFWQKLNSDTTKGWENIAFVNESAFYAKQGGLYRCKIFVETFTALINGEYTSQTCTSTLYSSVITIRALFPTLPLEYSVSGKKCIGDTITLTVKNYLKEFSYCWKDSKGNIYKGATLKRSLPMNVEEISLFIETTCNTPIDTTRLTLQGVEPIKESPKLAGYNTSCTKVPFSVKVSNFDGKNQYSWVFPKDSLSISGSSGSYTVVPQLAGVFAVKLKASNACNAIESVHKFYIEKSVAPISIIGSSLVQEKSLGFYTISYPASNVVWQTSKNIKYKKFESNGKSSLNVTFPKGPATAWITVATSNACSFAKDSFLIVVKPKFLVFTEIVDALDVNDIESRSDRASNTSEFLVFPNPVQDALQVSGDRPFDKVTLTDAAGKQFQLASNGSTVYDLSGLPAGNYSLCLWQHEQLIFVKKLIIIR